MKCAVLPKIDDALVTVLSKSIQIGENTVSVVQTEKHVKQPTQETVSFESEVIIKVLYAWVKKVSSPDYALGIMDVQSYDKYLYILGYIMPYYPVLIKIDGSNNVQWAKTFNCSSQMKIDMKIFDDGIVIIQYATNNLQIEKFDHDGNLLWQKQISESTGEYYIQYYSVKAVKKDNNIIVVARAYSTVDSSTSLLMIKLDSDGNILQSNLIKLSDWENIYPTSIELVGNNLVVVGNITSGEIVASFIMLTDDNLQPQKLVYFTGGILIWYTSANDNRVSITGYKDNSEYIIQVEISNNTIQVKQAVSIYPNTADYTIPSELDSYAITLDDNSIIASIPLMVGGGGG